MKKAFLIITIIFFNHFFCAAQEIAPAPAGKAVVYFVRMSSLGFAVNFSYFDSTRLIAKFHGTKYFRYECAPGSHLFWARSENKDFVEAELEEGKIYFIEAVPKMGAIKAVVDLVPLDPANEKKMNKVRKLLNKKSPETFTEEDLEKETASFDDVIARGMEKYHEDKTKGKKIAKLEKTMSYTVQ